MGRAQPVATPGGRARTIQHLFTRLKHPRDRPHNERLKIGTSLTLVRWCVLHDLGPVARRAGMCPDTRPVARCLTG
jgi:hypothetical protein